MDDRGRSDGARVIYYWAKAEGVVYLLALYPKSERVNLRKDQIALLRDLVREEFK
ncbi:hypothetical protein L6R50_13605 [Myxococcota bacterium]|nr:hypothetical protein [Myxococcota bacterium]